MFWSNQVKLACQVECQPRARRVVLGVFPSLVTRCDSCWIFLSCVISKKSVLLGTRRNRVQNRKLRNPERRQKFLLTGEGINSEMWGKARKSQKREKILPDTGQSGYFSLWHQIQTF